MELDPAWTSRGKTIKQLIAELQSFDDQSLEVRISLDDGKTSLPISLVSKRAGAAVLQNSEGVKSFQRNE
jgi:hypothetical protein